MTDLWYPSVLDVIALHDFIVERTGGLPGGGNEQLLEGAIMRPRMAAYYEGGDPPMQAALLIASIALAHAFPDGNKRTAFLAGDTFLRENGYILHSKPMDALGDLIIALVAEPDRRDEHVAALAALIADNLEPKSG